MAAPGILAGVALQLSKNYGRNLSSVTASPGLLSQLASDVAAGRVPTAVLCRTAGQQGWAVSRIASSLKSAPSSGLHRAWRQAQQAKHEALWKKTSLWDSLQRILQQNGRDWMLPLACSGWWTRQPALCFSLPSRSFGPELHNPFRRRPLRRMLGKAMEELFTWLRGLYLVMLFLPALLTAPLCVSLGYQRPSWVKLVRWTLERAGPAFIKWGQWSATRPDLFPPDVCQELSKLHTKAPQHSFSHTKRIVEGSLGAPLGDIFHFFNPAPVASGSIAQIHRGMLSEAGAEGTGYPPGTIVAVKVRHPGVETLMQRDFTLMMRAAKLSRSLPWLADLRLDESVRQFGGPLREQLDLSVEASSLDRFNHNFRLWRNLSFPKALYPLVTPAVLVETFEQGQLIHSFVDNPSNPHNAELANIGRDCFLKMLLNDNFIHADLHPGNILVRVVDPNSTWGRIAHFCNLKTAPHLVLLDVGMTCEMSASDQENIVQFFQAITSQNGRKLATRMLNFTEDQTCPDPEGFISSMAAMFDELDPDMVSEHTSEIITKMLEQVRQHQVDLKGVVSTIAVTTMVLEGWSSKLNPDIKIMAALRDNLPLAWRDRIAMAVDKFMSAYIPALST